MPEELDDTPAHQAADTIEVRMARALEKSFAAAARTLPVEELAYAAGAGDMRVVDRLLADWDVEDTLAPTAAIWHDAFLKGGKLAAEEFAAQGNPYEVVRQDGEWVVRKVHGKKVVGRHGQDKAKAMAHWRALEAATRNER